MSARAQTVRLTPARHRTLVGFAKTHGLSEYAMLARVVFIRLSSVMSGAPPLETRSTNAETSAL